MNNLRPIGAAIINGILVGSTIVATRFVIDQTSPASLAFLRYVIGLGCLFPLVVFSSRVRFEPCDILPISLLGIAQFGIVVTLLNYALQFIPSARAALIFATFPLMTMILSVAVGYERVTLSLVLGVLMTIVGVGLALGEKAIQPGVAANNWIGELAVLGSALSGAICSVGYRPYLRKYPTLPVSTLAMFASVIVLAVFAASEGFFNAVPRFTNEGWLSVGFIGVSSGVGYYLWLWALNHTTPTKVTVFLALSPITATILGVIFLAEQISVISMLGLVGVAFGLWLAHWQTREPLSSLAAEIIQSEPGTTKNH
ncbi:MAG: EamA family transporter [Chloroflexi bacterium]|nr:EamA family transporter [Chloroflexota bacterium]